MKRYVLTFHVPNGQRCTRGRNCTRMSHFRKIVVRAPPGHEETLMTELEPSCVRTLNEDENCNPVNALRNSAIIEKIVAQPSCHLQQASLGLA